MFLRNVVLSSSYQMCRSEGRIPQDFEIFFMIFNFKGFNIATVIRFLLLVLDG